ncbi:protein KHNYN-like [Anopheles gambiae]|uniref:protein KHNYN-like n=1 Tax=Anopheles gambiae TaxID=7165 RepID=UPI002AC896C8|nr:protein KHNYN-like [Anopheles gambiae]
MAINARKPSGRDGPNPFVNRKITRNQRNATKRPAPKAQPSRSHRSASLRTYPKKHSRRSIPSSPFHHTRAAITDLDIPLDSRRPVLIDGENVAYNDISSEYVANRIYQAYQWFAANGHRALVLCPDYLLAKLSGQTPHMPIELITDIPDERENHATNVAFELTLLQRAADEQAAIVSERSFASSYHSHIDVVQNRVVGFTFFRESIFIPVDPYGRAGPWLREILRK